MSGDQYDLVIIGGGIHGAALFWEAASRGVRALLVEKKDFGWATSANSLKVIHGGLRSLQALDLWALRINSLERRALTAIAPHLVAPMACLMPTDSSMTKNPWTMALGLKVYDALAWDRNHGLDPARYYGSSHLLSADLAATVLGRFGSDFRGAASWYDGQVYHPERLVLAFVMSALQKGGTALNYSRVQSLEVQDAKVTGVHLYDELTRQTRHVRANVVADCSGPWSNLVRAMAPGWHSPKVPFTRAVNLVVDKQIDDYAVGLKSKDPDKGGRLFFIAPWRHASIIGTWYLPDKDGPDAPVLAQAELDAMLAEINAVVPSIELRQPDISLIHFGRLPLVSVTGLRLQSKARVTHAVSSGGPAGLFTIVGVKFTTARHVAVCAMSKIAPLLHRNPGPSVSHHTPLYGGAIDSIEDYLQHQFDEYVGRYGEDVLLRLFRNYGSTMDAILMLADQQPDWAGPIPGVEDSLNAELHFVIENEKVVTLNDLILRRTDLGTAGIPAQETIDHCLSVLAQYKGWGPDERARQLEALQNHYPVWCLQPAQETVSA